MVWGLGMWREHFQQNLNFIHFKSNITGVSSADQGSWIEPSEPTLIHTHWCIGCENLSKLKSFNQGFFDWIKIVDFFYSKIDCFMGLKNDTKTQSILLLKNPQFWSN